MRTIYRKWSEYPYPGEQEPPKGSAAPGYWSMFFIEKGTNGQFLDLSGRVITWSIKHPNTVNWGSELALLEQTLHAQTNQHIQIAKYWGTGEVAAKMNSLAYSLAEAYRYGSPETARMTAYLNAAIHDTCVITWMLKYKWDVARPNQYGHSLPTVLFTPRFPSYPSAHATISGCAEAVLTYFFPAYSARIQEIVREAALSRFYAGVHFQADNDEGLRLGRQIGNIALRELGAGQT
ncbi:vanadium-dependent haloperoxidase [Ectobacillus ponti]|uniref:Vanadium-dependent haloperoxidase n=1 Tax=Ectobacillus ponti TaxID=2961894 RepID=A0AA41XDS6_9BACI|nr:vanadium-dependent haloperoxidase [Ectobacillus ponti]MCP8971048.1 vanadium-dependent haloperoxidase [Ectobacillus ponti]